MEIPFDGLLGVATMRVPRTVVDDAIDHLSSHGTRGLEAVALWAGRREGTTFHVESTIVPAQRAYRSAEGHHYVVEGVELQRINRHLYRTGLTLAAQLHSHSQEAYHSEADDAFPMVAVLGGLSVVVPDFALGPPSIEDWAVYRLMPGSGWTALEREHVAGLIAVV
jgi:hypothetical protein